MCNESWNWTKQKLSNNFEVFVYQSKIIHSIQRGFRVKKFNAFCHISLKIPTANSVLKYLAAISKWKMCLLIDFDEERSFYLSLETIFKTTQVCLAKHIKLIHDGGRGVIVIVSAWGEERVDVPAAAETGKEVVCSESWGAPVSPTVNCQQHSSYQVFVCYGTVHVIPDIPAVLVEKYLFIYKLSSSWMSERCILTLE